MDGSKRSARPGPTPSKTGLTGRLGSRPRPVPKILTGAVLPLLAVACLAPSLALAAEQRTVEYDFPAVEVREVELQFQFGTLHVLPGDNDQVHVELDLECRHRWGDCDERLEQIAVEADSRGSQLSIEVMGMSKRSNRGLHAEMRVYLPKEKGLEVHMGAGELRIEGLRGDIDVHLGAGEIDIRMAEEDVGTVDLQAGVGDANLKLRHGRAESERRHLVGGVVHWSRGEGDAEIGVRVGAGDIEVRLH